MRVVLIVIAIIFSGVLQAQQGTSIHDAGKKLQSKYNKAKQKWQNGEGEKALKEFKALIKKNPSLIEPYIEMSGICYEQKDLARAEYYLQLAIDLNPDFKPANIYSLARLQHMQAKYTLASANYQLFIDKADKKSKRLKQAKKYLQNAIFASEAVRNPVPFQAARLGEELNSSYSEYLPSISADEEKMIFTRRINNQEDFYQINFINGEISQAFPMESINSPFNEGAHCLSPDGNTLYYTFCHPRATLGSCDLFFTELKNGKWTKPVNLSESVNSRSWDAQPTISADGQRLIFSSKRRGGQGGSDLWISTKNKLGEWQLPKNLGDKINSDGNEESPFLHPDGKTLYFRSDGLPGMGDFDIYFSKWDAIQMEWGEPLNIGYPINSVGSEGALFVNLDGSKAFFASDQESLDDPNSPPNLDLFSFELPAYAKPELVSYVKATVTDKISGETLNAKLEIIDMKDPAEVLKYETGSDGEFLICLPVGSKYSLTVKKEKYSFHSEHFQLDSVSSFTKAFLLDIELTPLFEKSDFPDAVNLVEPVVLNNLFFKSGSASLLPESGAEVDNLVQLLSENQALRIKIIGHTDNVGSEEDNLRLSEDRAESVYLALIDKGIDASRLQYEGQGEIAAIADNSTAEGRQKNRRTEFVILSH